MKSYNAIDMKGRLYDYNLEARDTDKGEVIVGTVTLEVDEKGTQATIRFYARPKYNSGKTNRTYTVLDEIMAGNYKTVVTHGEDADWLGATGNIDVSYFIGREGAKTPEEMNSGMQLRGGFLNANNKKEYANKWKLDLLITGVTEVEADPERGFDRYARVNGYCVDSYNERVMNVAFDARTDAAINYVLGLTCSAKEPVFFPAWGCLLKVGTRRVQKNVFGDGGDDVVESERTRWVLTGLGEQYNFGDEADMSVEDYETYRKNLADHKAERFAAQNEDAEDSSPDLAF